MASRHLDHAARWLRARGSASTRSAQPATRPTPWSPALRPTDPALLHYRSGGFYLARAQPGARPRRRGRRPLGPARAADEPIAGGRHKVFGHADLAVIPQTSTIASHLPRALGVAFAIGADGRLGVATAWPAGRARRVQLRRRLAQPLDGAGRAQRRRLHRPPGDAPAAAVRVRGQRLGHQRAVTRGLGRGVAAGAGRLALRAGRRHRPRRRVRRDRGAGRVGPRRGARRSSTCDRPLRRDTPAPTSRRRTAPPASGPTATATRCWRRPPARRAGLATPDELVADLATRQAGRAPPRSWPAKVEHRRRGDRAAGAAPPDAVAERVAAAAGRARSRFFGGRGRGGGPADAGRVDQPALADLLAADPSVARVRRGRGRQGRRLRRHPRPAARPARPGSSTRCSTSRRSSASASATGVSGLLPIPEIQYLAYLHNAEDQLRGEAATLSFFSNGQYLNPMVVRIAGYGYQKGFGGHFHNDNAVGGLRDIPGVVIASPATGPMRRRCCARAPPRRPMARCACSSSRSRCTTPATSTPPATAVAVAVRPARAGRKRTCRSASGRSPARATTS